MFQFDCSTCCVFNKPHPLNKKPQLDMEKQKHTEFGSPLYVTSQYGSSQQFGLPQQFGSAQQFDSLPPRQFASPQQFALPQQFLPPQYVQPEQFGSAQHFESLPQNGSPQQFAVHQMPNIPKKYSRLQDLKRNTPQINSVMPATFIFMINGMTLPSVLGLNVAPFFTGHTQYCYFIAVIIGALISALLIRKIPKRLFYFAASGVVMISGSLHIGLVEYDENALVATRYLNGISFGLVLIPTIVDASELTVKRLRGIALSTEQIAFATGALIAQTYIFNSNYNLILGLITLGFGVLAFALTYLHTLESPIFYLLKDNETEALNVLRQSQNPKVISYETYDILNEHKCLIAEDKAEGIQTQIFKSILPLAKVIAFRVLTAMSFSFAMTFVIALTAIFDLNEPQSSMSTTVLVVMIFRWFGACVGYFTLDLVGRKVPSILSSIVGGALLIGIISQMSPNGLSAVLIGGFWLVVFYQCLAQIMAPAGTCYLGEAFPVSIKPYCILLIVVIENILQIYLCSLMWYEDIYNFLWVLAILHIVSGLAFIVFMPETNQTTLREALKRFQSLLNFKMF